MFEFLTNRDYGDQIEDWLDTEYGECGKPKAKKPLHRPRYRWKDIIKVSLKIRYWTGLISLGTWSVFISVNTHQPLIQKS